MHEPLRVWLDEFREIACAPLLRLLVEQLAALEPPIEPDVGAFGVRFLEAGRLTCEVSVFGDLFIVRVGPEGAVEYRVRDRATLRAALDAVLRARLAVSSLSAPLAGLA